jgi:hypothetical protein
VKSRLLARAAALLAGVVVPVVLLADPALAKLDDGEKHAKPLSTGEILLVYVVIPVGMFLVIAFFAALPSMLRRPRYRPGRPWAFDPLWFAGPEDTDKALAGARPGVTAKGGASAEW